MSMTKSEIKKKLDEAGIAYSDDSTKSELKEMLDELNESNEKPENTDINSNDIVEKQDSIETEEEIEVKVNPYIGRQATQVECMNQMIGKKPDGSEWNKK